ncbi:MAG TPA: outer membrane protein assembly factor BamA [Terriglobia bacterium]|nr:outer membrane protein assembly factor BamA [Terriglobia bacterium]
MTRDPDEIEVVEIRGNRNVRTATIKNNMRTKGGDRFNPDTITRDIRTLYTLGWFDDIYVEEEPGSTGGKDLIFYFKERPNVRSIDFEGVTTITKSDILTELRKRKVNVSTEKPFDQGEVRRAITVVKRMLAEKGKDSPTITYTADPIGLSVPPTAVALIFKVDEGPKVRIQEINIKHDKTIFSDREIKRAMKLIKETGPITVFTGKDTYYDLKLQDDITRIRILLAEHGYARANVLEPTVELRPKEVFRTLPFIRPPLPWGIPIPFWKKTVDRYYINIELEENDQYRIGDIKIKGNTVWPEETLKKVMGINSGDIFNDTLLRNAMENLKKVYGSQGYVNFSPNRDHDFDEANKIVNLTIDIDEGDQYYVNRITFSGNTTTRDKVIRREFLLSEGGLYRSTLLDTSILRLNQLGYFDEIKETDAEIKFNRDPKVHTVDIDVKVKERGKNTIGVNGGISGIGGGFVGMTYETNNFLGRGNALTLNVQGGAQQSTFVFSYSEPYLLDRPLSLGVSVYGQSYEYDQAREIYGLDPTNLPAGLGFENRLNYQQNRRGFSVTTSYPLRLFKRVGLMYQFENSETNAVNPATQEYFLAVNQQQRTEFSTNTGTDFGIFHSRKLVPSFTWRTVDSAYFPTRGHSLTLAFDYTGGLLGGNTNFIRPTMQFEYYRPHTKHRNVLAFRFITSYITGFSDIRAPFYERVYAGGDYDLRGFDFRTISPVSFITRYIDSLDAETGATIKKPFDDIVQVGGDTQAIANLEYRIPLVGPITFAGFMDVGNSWVLRKSQLQRELIDSTGNLVVETPKFMQGTNSGLRMSTGVELQVIVPVINAPVRFIWAVNPLRLNNIYLGPVTGTPFQIYQPGRDFKFSMGRTF